MEFIKNETFRSEVREFLKGNIRKRVPRFSNGNTYAPEFIAQRYLQCFELNTVPSKNTFMDYLNFSEKDKFNPNMAATACEFYGGIFYKSIEENPKEFFTLGDISYRLKASYSTLSQINPIYIDLFDFHEEILASYRQTTDKFASGRMEDERIFKFHH